MTIEEIYQKYIKAMQQATGDGTWVDWGVVRLGLRLAIADAYTAAPAIISDLSAIVAALHQERDELRERLERIDAGRDPQIAHDYEKEIAGLNEQLAEMDADNSDMSNRLHQAQKEIDRLQHQYQIAVDAFNARQEESWTKTTPGQSSTPTAALMASGEPAAVATSPAAASTHQIAALPPTQPASQATNGNASPATMNSSASSQTIDELDPTSTPDWNRQHPAWKTLTAEERVTVYQLTSKEIVFRQVSKPLRLKLIGLVMTHMRKLSMKMSMGQFDRNAPHWMPDASGLAQYAGGKWSDLVELALKEVEA